MQKLAKLCLGFGLWWLVATLAQAHLVSAGQGFVNVLEDQIVMLIGIPIDILKDVDENKDGFLQPEEIKKHQQRILAQLGEGFHLELGGVTGEVIHQELMVSVHVDDNKSTNQLEWGRRLGFPGAIQSKAPIRIRLSWYDSDKDPNAQQVYAIQVRRSQEVESAVLHANHREHVFFANPPASAR